MAFAQLNYPQTLGNGPYTLAEAGCFITAFCNLLARFGETVDPPTLNTYFILHNKYTHDPSEPAGTDDDVSWGTVSAYDGSITVTSINGLGWPQNNDSIVEFNYISPHTGQKVTHFCLVVNSASRTILDSYDGTVKVSPYGDPVASATYQRATPQVVTPPPPATAPAYTVKTIDPVKLRLKVNTHLWDLNQRTWPAMVNNPVSAASAGSQFVATALATHILGGQYYMSDASQPHGYNTVDCDPAPVSAPDPAPTSTPVALSNFDENIINGIKFSAYSTARTMYVTKIGGAQKWRFSNVKSWGDFTSLGSVDFGTKLTISGVATVPVSGTTADYYMTDEDFGDFVHTGAPKNMYGFNWSDVSDKKPTLGFPAPSTTLTPPVTPLPVIEPPAPKPEPVPAPTPAPDPTPAENPNAWKSTYKTFKDVTGQKAVIKYWANKDYTVVDLDGKGKPVALKQHSVIDMGGTFVGPDGALYFRPEVAANIFKWYGIPVGDSIVEPYDQVFSSSTTSAERISMHNPKATDYIVQGIDEISKIGVTLEKAWDMLPFNKNKNKRSH